MSYDIYILVFGVAICAGFVDSIAGGGGLLTIPTLLAVGLSPTQALATNKLQGTFGSLSASIYFLRHKLIDTAAIRLPILFTFFFSCAGSFAVLHLDAIFLRFLIPCMLLGFGLFFLFSPQFGTKTATIKCSLITFALLSGCIGFYDGFFGPGTGTFFAFIFVYFMGYTLTYATAHAKILNFTSNSASLLCFFIGGHINWKIGCMMGIGQFIGAALGSKTARIHGKKIIRPLIVFISFTISFKLLLNIF